MCTLQREAVKRYMIILYYIVVVHLDKVHHSASVAAAAVWKRGRAFERRAGV